MSAHPFTPEQIAAYADDELDLLTARRIEHAMASDTDLAETIAGHRALRRRLANHFAPVLDEPVPASLLAPLTVVDTSLESRRQHKDRTWFGTAQWSAIAAALVFGLLMGRQVDRRQVDEREGALIAQGSLASALDTQLASAQGSNPATRIGLTFRDASGTICRSFEARTISGIACRSDADWQLRQTFGRSARAEYRQASSSPLADAVADMIGGSAALNAKDETAARDRHWR